MQTGSCKNCSITFSKAVSLAGLTDLSKSTAEVLSQFFYSYSDAHTPTLRQSGHRRRAGSIITLRGTGWTSIPGNDGTISVTASGEPVSCGVITLSNYSNNSNASLMP